MLRRWLMFGLALMLLTLCLAAWGVSYWRRIYVIHHGKTSLSFILNSGRVSVEWAGEVGTAPGWYSVNKKAGSWDAQDKRSTFCWLGFSYSVGIDGSYLTIPLWFPSLLSLILLWFAWRKARLTPKGKAFPIEPSIEAKSPSV